MKKISIKPARFGDYVFVNEVFAQSNRDHVDMRPDLYRTVERPVPRLTFAFAVAAAGLGRNMHALLVARLDEERAGSVFVLSQKRSKLSWSRFEAEAVVDNISVMPAFRRQGVGTALLRAACAWAVHTGHQHMNVKILGNNAGSRALFEKAGFAADSVNAGLSLKK